MSNSSTARVIIVDPTDFFRAGMYKCLAAGMHVMLSEARNLQEALQQSETLQPDLVVIGQNLAEHESLELCREVTSRWPAIKPIIFTAHADDPLFQSDAIHAGAAACLRVGVSDEECLAAITAVMSGHQLFSREILALAFEPIKLTVREHEVLKLLAEGKTDRGIARALTVKTATVRSHSQHILEKLGVHDRREAVRRARRRGLV